MTPVDPEMNDGRSTDGQAERLVALAGFLLGGLPGFAVVMQPERRA